MNQKLVKKLDIKGGKSMIIKKRKSVKENHQENDIYPLHSLLRKDYQNIKLSDNQKIFVCVYQINTKAFKPFLQYTLWKYPTSSNAYSDILIFPFSNNVSTPLKTAKKIKKSIKKENAILKGYLLYEFGAYFFFEDVLSINKLNLKHRQKKKWWVTIDEICNHKCLMKFPIHKTVFKIFFKFPQLIYLLNKNNQKLEIPIIGYWGGIKNQLPMTAVFGARKHRSSIYGPFYYFGSYNSAIRYATFDSLYKPCIKKNNKVITNKEGKYKQGGIIRFILFLGNLKVLINHPNDITEQTSKNIFKDIIDVNNQWSEKYDSLIVGRAPLANGFLFRQTVRIIVKKFNQQHPLSIHLLDMKSTKRTWDPVYNKYYIQ